MMDGFMGMFLALFISGYVNLYLRTYKCFHHENDFKRVCKFRFIRYFARRDKWFGSVGCVDYFGK